MKTKTTILCLILLTITTQATNITITHLDDTNSYYDANGTQTDQNRGTKLLDIVNNIIISGDEIILDQNTYDIGNNVLSLSKKGTRTDINLTGKGIDKTIIKSSARMIDLGCIINPANNSVISNITIDSNKDATDYRCPIGDRNDSQVPIQNQQINKK